MYSNSREEKETSAAKQQRHLEKNVSNYSSYLSGISEDETENTVVLRNKLALNIDTQKAESEKYNSGGGTPNLLAKLRTNPKEFNIKSTGAPKQGAQANVDYVTIRTKSEYEINIVRKKEKKGGNFSLNNEIKISYSIKNHAEYEKIKAYLSLPFYDEKRSSGNEIYLRFKRNGDLESYRKYIKENSSEAQTYLFQQTRSIVKILDFLHNGDFSDEQGNKHKGIIHGDIKPDNILVDKNGDLSLSDFGCARYAEEPIEQLGMVTYLSPELLKIYAGEEVPSNPGKSDIWSLGVTLQSLVTGEYPIEPSPQSAIVSMSPMFSKDETDTRGYIIEIKQDAVSYLKMDERSGYTVIEPKQVGNSTHFFSDTFQGQEIRTKKMDEYLQSEICKKNFESKKLIEDVCKNSSHDNMDKSDILHHLTSSMLLPIEQRPTARELTETMDKLARYFPYDQKNNFEFVKKMTASSNPIADETTKSLIFKEEKQKQTQTQLEPKLSPTRQVHKELLDNGVKGVISTPCSFFSNLSLNDQTKGTKSKKNKPMQNAIEIKNN